MDPTFDTHLASRHRLPRRSRGHPQLPPEGALHVFHLRWGLRMLGGSCMQQVAVNDALRDHHFLSGAGALLWQGPCS